MANAPAPFAVQDEPDLRPLRASHEADALEAELKAMFMGLFAQYLRPGVTALSTVGAPHLGDVDQLERAVKMDGLALQRGADEASMRYIHKAFRARNPKRGLHMLRTYLRVMFGAGWSINQMWQDTASPYPTALHEEQAPGRFLTSRVHVNVVSSASMGTPEQLAQSLRSVLPARMVLKVSLSTQPMTSTLRMACVISGRANWGRFTGEFTGSKERRLAESTLRVAVTGFAVGERLQFTGTFTHTP